MNWNLYLNRFYKALKQKPVPEEQVWDCRFAGVLLEITRAGSGLYTILKGLHSSFFCLEIKGRIFLDTQNAIQGIDCPLNIYFASIVFHMKHAKYTFLQECRQFFHFNQRPGSNWLTNVYFFRSGLEWNIQGIIDCDVIIRAVLLCCCFNRGFISEGFRELIADLVKSVSSSGFRMMNQPLHDFVEVWLLYGIYRLVFFSIRQNGSHQTGTKFCNQKLFYKSIHWYLLQKNPHHC